MDNLLHFRRAEKYGENLYSPRRIRPSPIFCQLNHCLVQHLQDFKNISPTRLLCVLPVRQGKKRGQSIRGNAKRNGSKRFHLIGFDSHMPSHSATSLPFRVYSLDSCTELQGG